MADDPSPVSVGQQTPPPSRRTAPQSQRTVRQSAPRILLNPEWIASSSPRLERVHPARVHIWTVPPTRERNGRNPKPEMIERGIGLWYSAFFRVSAFGIRIWAAGGDWYCPDPPPAQPRLALTLGHRPPIPYNPIESGCTSVCCTRFQLETLKRARHFESLPHDFR